MIDLYTFNIGVLIWLASALLIFPVLLKVTAPYGRFTRSNWGPMIDNKRGWIIMESPSILGVAFFYFTGSGEKTWLTSVFVGLWLRHYTNRVLIFPFKLKTPGKKMPVAIMIFALIFNLVNGFINGYYFGNFATGYELSWLIDPRFIVGIIMFFGGMLINMQSDEILIGLRRTRNSGYKIPYGGFFRFVSCPNYMGEMIEWSGFAIMVWTLPALAFAVWTIVNLMPRALSNHKWYKQQFPDYPKERKAVIPHLL